MASKESPEKSDTTQVVPKVKEPSPTDEENDAGLDIVTFDNPESPEKILPLERRRKVVMCYDGSETSQYAFDWAYEHVLLPFQDHVFFIFAHNQGWVDTHALKESITGERIPTKCDEVVEKVRGLSKDLIKIGITSQLITTTKSPGKFIVSVVKDRHADMVIMGSRGRNLAKRTVLGSVSHYVLGHVDCPVLIIKHPKERETIYYEDSNNQKNRRNSLNLDRTGTRDSLRLVRTRSGERDGIALALARTRSREH